MKKSLLIIVLTTIVSGLMAQAQVKTTAKPAAGTSLVSGTFSGPAGSNIVLQNNGKNDLTLTAKKETGMNYSSNPFSFAAPFPDGSKFKITVKKASGGQTCVIYAGGEGTLPQTAASLNVGCDFTYDLLSRSSDNKSFSTFYETSNPVVGGNQGEEGRYVVFISSVSFAGSTGKHRQIFWRDRNAGITKLISTSPTGEEGNADSYAPAISGDGKTVAFESYSSNLVQNDKNGFRDIFVWHSNTGKIDVASIGKKGIEANAESYEPTVSGDGNFIAFTSMAGNISPTDKGVSNNNVYLRDLQVETTIMISVDPTTKQGGGGSNPSISYDGNRIAFYSHTSTLVSSDNNGLWDIFLWEKDKKPLKRISLTADGKERDQGSESANRIVAPAISGNGLFIAYATTTSNMVPGDNNNFQDVFVYDINANTTTIASNGSDGKSGNGDSPIEQGEKIAISFNGKWVAFSTKASNLGVPSANIVMRNIISGENKAISTVVGSSVGRPAMSSSGSYVIFGIGGQIDSRYKSSGVFANFTGVGPCLSCPE